MTIAFNSDDLIALVSAYKTNNPDISADILKKHLANMPTYIQAPPLHKLKSACLRREREIYRAILTKTLRLSAAQGDMSDLQSAVEVDRTQAQYLTSCAQLYSSVHTPAARAYQHQQGYQFHQPKHQSI